MSKQRRGGQKVQKRRRFFDRGAPVPAALTWAVAVVAVAMVFLTISVCVMVVRAVREPGFADAELLPSGTDVRLQGKTFEDRQVHFYRYVTTARREVRFFVAKLPDGRIRAAFDACERCYEQRRGFRHVGNEMVCNNCGRRFPLTTELSEDHCNPVRLDRVIDGDQILLKTASLERGARYF